MTAPQLSIVVPAWNEADSLPDLVRRIQAVFPPGTLPAIEIIIVDDGSGDDTGRFLDEARRGEPRLVPIAQEGHRGQTAALWAGLACARADWVAHMDADLQNDPVDLRTLYTLATRGFDAVLGYRVRRRDTTSRRIASAVARNARQLILGDDVIDVGCATRVVRRDALEQIPPLPNAHRYLPALLSMMGCRMAQVPVGHHFRRYGASKYTTLGRSLEALRDVWRVRSFIRSMQAQHRRPDRSIATPHRGASQPDASC